LRRILQNREARFEHGVKSLLVAAASCASFIVVARMLTKLDMVGVLKARD